MLSRYYGNESLTSQIQASERENQFQANSTKRHVDEVAVVILTAQKKPIPQSITQYDLRQHNYFSYAITALQVGISLSAIAVIARNRRIWYLGMGLGTVDIACTIFAAASASIAAPVFAIHQSANK